MGAIVKYRDLPGGPTDVQLGEEMSRHCLCTQCGMLSMSLYQDRQEHVFCSACIEERSFKDHKYDIFCKYEQRNVSLSEMFDANDVITVIRDQFTICPNKVCRRCVPLEALNDHYSQCTPRVQCSVCRQDVQSRDWNEHWKKHSGAAHEEQPIVGRRDVRSPKTYSPENHIYKLGGQTVSPGYSPRSPGRSKKSSTSFASMPATTSPVNSWREATGAGSALSGKPQQPTSLPFYPFLQNSAAGGESAHKIEVCQNCKRNVKEANLTRHLEVCPKVMKDCVYCGDDVVKENMTAHFKTCHMNPDNVTQESSWPHQKNHHERKPATGCGSEARRTWNTTTGATGGNASKAYSAEDGNEALQPQGLKADAHGGYPLEKIIPELPITDVEIEDMKTWRCILEQQFRVHGISDNWQKFEVLMSTLPPDVLRQVPKTAETLPPHQAYGYLLEVLFQLSRSGDQRDMIDSITKATKEKLKKLKLKFKQAAEILRDAFLSGHATPYGVPESTARFYANHNGFV